ncbi:MAG: restriction endonuclease subunit S [Ardenticatenia bacterium]|nr:restriction endonuclease subunit S [Ardenticatenia bacterium]
MTEVGVVPDDWEVSQLGTLAETSSGTTPARALRDRYYRNGSVPWIKTMDLSNAELWDTSECVTDLALKETSLSLYGAGTVLIAMYGGFQQIGRTGLLRLPATVNQAITAIRPATRRLTPEYLLAVLNYRVDHWRSVASSSRKDSNITSHDVRSFPIACPDLPEQRAIAAALSDVDALLGGLDRLIAKKRDLKQAAMQQLLTGQTRLPGFSGEWEVRRLGDALSICHGRNQREVEDPNGVFPILATGGQIGTASRHLCDKPSVLIGRKGTIDQPRYMETPFWTVDTLFYSTMKGDNNARFLYYRFCLIDWMQYNEASGVPSLNARTIESVEVDLPVPAEQDAIAAVLSDMDAELTALEARRDKTRDLKQAMMQELLTGRTRLV